MKVKLFNSLLEAEKVLENEHPRLVRAEGKEICIVRKGDKLFAFQNACAHMGESLHQGKVNYLNEIVCPLHTYRFNMRTGEETNQRCASLEIYKVISSKEGIFLEI